MSRKSIILIVSFCALCVSFVLGYMAVVDKIQQTKSKMRMSTSMAYNDYVRGNQDEYRNRVYGNIIASKKLQQKLDMYNKVVASQSHWSAGTHKVCVMDLHDGLNNAYGNPFQRLSCVYWSEQNCGDDDSTEVNIGTEVCNENIAFKMVFTNAQLSLFPSLTEHLGNCHRKYTISFYLAEPLHSMVNDTIDLQSIGVQSLRLDEGKAPEMVDNLLEYSEACGGGYDHTILGAVKMYMQLIGMDVDLNVLRSQDPIMKEYLRQEDCIGLAMMSVMDGKDCCIGLVCVLLPYIYELRMDTKHDRNAQSTKKYKMYNNDVVTFPICDEIFSYARPSDMTKTYAYYSILDAMCFMKYIIDDGVVDDIVTYESLFN